MTSHPPRRSWFDVRWRQFRNAPRPIVRAVGANLLVAAILGIGYLAYDVALTRGATLPGGGLFGSYAVCPGSVKPGVDTLPWFQLGAQV